MKRALVVGLFVVASSPCWAQLAEQSKLTLADRDPDFELTLDHLARDVRAFGLSPREIVWAPDGSSVYFRWREDPASGQLPESDPWCRVSADGAKLSRVADAELWRVPSDNLAWSADRGLAAWTRKDSLVVWTRSAGPRVVFTTSSTLGRLHVASDGSSVFFATKGHAFRSEESGDLWAYDVERGLVHQIATAVEKEKEATKQEAWLEEQQLELIEIVRKRKDFEDREEALARAREVFRPQPSGVGSASCGDLDPFSLAGPPRFGGRQAFERKESTDVSQVLDAEVCCSAFSVLLSLSAGAAPADVGPQFKSAGPLAFGPENVLFVADNLAAVIYALELDGQASGKTAGTKDVPGIDQKIAGLLGTDAREITITDLAIHPKSKNAFLTVVRGQGAGASALLRVDGAGQIDVITLDKVKYTKVDLPNAPAANPEARRDPRQATITDMAFVNGRLYIAGLSNEEFASKLRAVKYPFESADRGTSVEIYHGAHGQWETRSPVYTFVPYDIDDEPHLIAGYLCTPLVKFPVAELESGKKVVGTTIAELGNRNRPIDMVVYQKNGKDYLLMSNTSRGVMKIPTDGFGSQESITTHVSGGGTSGVAYETIKDLKGVEQLDS